MSEYHHRRMLSAIRCPECNIVTVRSTGGYEEGLYQYVCANGHYFWRGVEK